ncbi:MAG: hypothetical protein FWE07_02165 [Turicibacter sp.]|nr:hypothetical protein [Turicibacter sp.]
MREFRDVVNSLESVISDLQSSNEILEGSLRTLSRELSSTEGAFASFESGANLLLGTLGFLALAGHDLSNIPANIEGAAGAITGFIGKLGGLKLTLGTLGIAAVVTLIGSLTSSIRMSSEAAIELNERLIEMRHRHRDAIGEINASIRSNNNLAGALLNLNSQAIRNNDEQREMIRLVRILNAEENGLILTYDELSEGLSANSVAMLEQHTQRNEINASAERGAQYLDSLIYAMNAEAEASEALEDVRERREAANEAAGDAVLTMREVNEAALHGEFVHGQLNQSLEELSREYEAISYVLESVGADVEYFYEAWTENASSHATQIREYIDEHGLSYEILNEAQQYAVDQMVERWTEYRDNGREMFQELGNETRLWYETTDAYGNAVRMSYLELEDGQNRAMQAMIDNLRNNREATAEWSNNLDDLAYRTSEEFAEHMRSMGIGSAAYVQAMLDGCSYLLEELYTEFGLAGTYATNNMTGSLGEGAEEVINLVSNMGADTGDSFLSAIQAADFQSIGIMIPRAAMLGVEEGTPEYEAAVRSLGQDGNDAFEEVIGYSSPSRVYRGYGESIIQGLVIGLEALRAQPIRSMQTLARDMQRIYSTANRDYINVGRDIMRGLNQGLLNGEAQVMNTARRIANQVTQAMRQALNINSPSRVMQEEIGRQIPAGVAEGIDKYGSYATDSMYDLGNELAKVKFPSINDVINMGSSLNLASVSNGGNSSYDNRVINNHSYAGLFDGANITWNGEEDIRRTMEKMARAAEEDSYRMW